MGGGLGSKYKVGAICSSYVLLLVIVTSFHYNICLEVSRVSVQ